MDPRINEITKLKDNDRITLGDSSLEIIHLAGHTPGSIGILYHEEKIMCTGDMLFDDFPMLDHYPQQGSMIHFRKSMEKIIELIKDGKVIILPTLKYSLMKSNERI